MIHKQFFREHEIINLFWHMVSKLINEFIEYSVLVVPAIHTGDWQTSETFSHFGLHRKQFPLS